MKKEFYSEHTLLLTNCGREDCSDLHSWGPGIRPCYIIHYVIKGAGWLEYGKKCFYIQAGQSFLLYPYTVLRYYPDPEQPWEYTWVDFMGEIAPELLSNTGFSPVCPVSPAISPQQILPLYERLCSLDILYHNQGEACGLLMALLGLYADSFPGSPALNSHREDNRLSTAILLIQTHLYLPLPPGTGPQSSGNGIFCQKYGFFLRLFRSFLFFQGLQSPLRNLSRFLQAKR